MFTKVIIIGLSGVIGLIVGAAGALITTTNQRSHDPNFKKSSDAKTQQNIKALASHQSASTESKSVVVALQDRLPDRMETYTPRPELSPNDVVRLQLDALRRAGGADEIDAALEDCYAFASPANRQAIGSLSKFKLVVNQAYSNLIGHRSSLVGRAIPDPYDLHIASVMVSGTGFDGEPMLYSFTLSQQNGNDFQDCWMTDTVVEWPIKPSTHTKISSNRFSRNFSQSSIPFDFAGSF